MTNPFALENIASSQPAEAANNPFALSNIPAAKEQADSDLRVGLSVAVKQNPDQAARAAQLAKQQNLPADVLARNLQNAEFQQAVIDADRELQTSPRLAQALREKKWLAEQTHDDIPNTAKIERTITGTLGDVGVTALKGAVGLPQAFVGITNILTGGLTGRAVESSGVRFEDAQKFLDTLYSPAQQRANLAVSEAQGFVDTLTTMISNPSTIATTVGEAVPQMLGGAAIGRGLVTLAPRLATWLAAALGEGVMGAGSAAEQYRSESESGLLTAKQAFASVGSGAGTALFGAAGGRLAQKLGVGDIDTALIQKGMSPADAAALQRGFASAVARAGVGEGVFEELPQSVQEQMWQNWTNNRPLGEGVGKAAAQGLLAGLAMGGGFQAVAETAQRIGERMGDEAAMRRRDEAESLRVQELLQLAAQSKLRERNPEAFRELMSDMIEANPQGRNEIYVDAEVLSALPPETLNQLPPSVVEQLQTATPDTPVAISMADVLTIAPGSDLATVLDQNARMRPDAPNKVEAQQYEQMLQQDMERVVSQAADAQALATERETVKQSLLADLNNAGRYTSDVNEAYATMAAAMFTTQAARMGVTPSEIYQRFQLRVANTSAAQRRAQGDALTQAPTGAQQFEAAYAMRDGRQADIRLEQQILGQGNDRQLGVRVMAMDPTVNKPFGYVDFEVVGNTLRAANTVVAQGARRQGLAEAMYRAARAAGYDIAPGRAQTPDGMAMVERLRERGVINREVADDGTLFQSGRAGGDTTFADRARALLDSKPTPALSTVGIVDGKEEAPRFANITELAAYFTKKNRAKAKDLEDPKTQAKIADALYAETLHALTDSGNAIGWYDRKTRAALDIITEIHPELATDEQSRFAFIAILAVTSNGLRSRDNFVIAEQLYRETWRTTGRFPESVPNGGPRSNQMGEALALLNRKVDELGWQAVRDFMATKHTAKEVRDFAGASSFFGEQATAQVPGALFLGPKLGSFFNNLYGDFSTVTMDRWFMRTMNRIRGRMLSLPTSFTKNLGTLREQIQSGVDTYGVKPEKILAEIAAFEQATPEQQADVLYARSKLKALQQYVRARHRDYARPKDDGTGKKRSFLDRTPENYLAKNIDLAMSGSNDAPFGATDRTWVRGVMDQVQQRLQADGIEISNADLQAVLWYYEKDLYANLIGRGAQDAEAETDVAEDAEAKEAEDYETAARFAVARLQREGLVAGSAGSARPGDDGVFQQGGVNGRPEQTGNGGGGYSAGGLAPLPGAPSVAGASGPDPRLVAVAEQYAASIGVDLRRPAEYVVVDEQRAARIAEAYAAMPHAPQDPAVQEAYQNLIAQTVAQYRALEAAGYKFYLFDESNDPYAGNPWNAMRDLRANQTMGVFATEAGFGSGATDLDVSNNPLMADTGIEWPYGGPDGPMKRVLANDLFRAVHDAFGHGLEGAGFRAQGEENAWQAHVRLFTGSAVGAITSETRGQNSWLNYGPYGATNRNASVENTVFADQKTGLMPEWTWTEGRTPDMDDGTQREQRRLRQDVDLSVLQAGAGDTLNQSAPRVEQTETPSFKAWFGDSKAVEAVNAETGRPLTSSKEPKKLVPQVMYHTTRNNFNEFEIGRITINSGTFGDWETSRAAVFVTPELQASEAYGKRDGRFAEGANVMPLYIKAENPLDLTAGFIPQNIADRFDGIGFSSRWLWQFDWSKFDGEEGKDFVNAARQLGYDSVIFNDENPDTGESFEAWALFESTQIKSAIGNRGTFDGNDPNILNQEAKPGQVAVTGLHFSRQPRTTVNGAFYGTGLRGAERDRVFNGDDQRLRSRVYFYVDEGKGVVPEAGVGGVAHSAELTNLYDINSDPLKLAAQGGGVNAIESRILDAGFDGYYRASFANNAGVAVVIGAASRSIPVTRIEQPNIGAIGGNDFVEPTVRVQLTTEQLDALDVAAIEAAGGEVDRSFVAVRPNYVRIPESQVEALRPVMSAVGVQLPVRAAAMAQTEAGQGGPLGEYAVSEKTIGLLKDANYSTFVHELGHFYLEMLSDMAADPNATPEIVADMQTLLNWFGVADLATWRSQSINERRSAHERFAESFEQYVLEGKAPSKELQPLFSRFRAWLTTVYKSLRQFLQGRELDLTDEVRSVFDRMLATQEQIDEITITRGLLPAFDSAAMAGMTEEEWVAYQATAFQAQEEALAKLQSRSVRDLRWVLRAVSGEMKKIAKDVEGKRKAVEDEVRPQVQAQPVYAVQRWLKTGVLPDGTTSVGAKLSTEALRDMYGDGPAAPWRYLATNLVAKEDGLHPDMVAEMFGFESGDQMVRAIVDAFPEQTEIDGRVDQLMLERYGDLTTPEGQRRAAEEAVHNEARARMVATELKAAAKATTPVRALQNAAKQFAATLVARRKVKDLKHAQFTAAETRAVRRANEAMASGNTTEAAAAKRDQLLNFYAAREVLAAQNEVRKIREFFARIGQGNDETTVQRGRDPDVINAMRAVLAAYGIAPARGKTAAEYMAVVQRNDPTMFNALNDGVQEALANAQGLAATMAASGAKGSILENMTLADLRDLNEQMQSMWELAKRSRQMEVDGTLLDLEEAEAQLKDKMLEIGIPETMPGDRSALTPAEKARRKLQYALSLLRRVEQWAIGLDGAYGGPFLRLVFQPVKVAADRYRAERITYRRKYEALVRNLAPSLKKGTIEAPELNYTFGKDEAGVGLAELLHAVLHTGNDSNKRKLLLGRGWATENPDGTLDTARWDAFIKRMQDTGVLAKEHYDFAQGVWDLLEEMKPAAQKAHRDVFGRYFAEVTANEFSTPFGTYRGGYVPAQADPELVNDQALRKLAEAENENMAYSFPATNRGFTKSRVDYNRQLKLDLRSLTSHIDKVLLFTHMQPAINDVNRLLSRKGVSYGLSRIDPTAYDGMLIPWLNRSAKQIVETPVVGDGGVSRMLTVARNRAGLGLMLGNISNTLQQITGLTSAAALVPKGDLMRAVATYVASPKATANAVAEASSFMRDRMENEIAVINGAMEEILLDPTTYQKAQAFTQRHAYFMQAAFDNVISPIVWTAAYNEALKRGDDDRQAVGYADSVVRQTQTSTLPEDVSRIETGPAYARIFTQFLGYFNMIANTNATALMNLQRQIGFRKGAGKALGIIFFGVLAPAWIAEAIALAFRGGPEDGDDDEIYLDDWLSEVIGMGTLKFMLANIPFAGTFAVAGLNRFNDNPVDDKVSLSPAVSLLESAVGAPNSVYEAIVEDGSARRAVNDVATLVTIATGLPARAVARPVGYLAGVANDEIEPTSPADFARGLVTGSVSPESRQ